MAESVTALAIFAHPDDIEFVAAGTLLLLREAGWATHVLTLAGGDCGSTTTGPEETRRIRATEGRQAAAILGATFHEGFASDLCIFYEKGLLRRLAAVVRRVRPRIVLTHSPDDYMEDHMNTARLAVTAAFARGMPNFETSPPEPPYDGDVTVYHAMPHGLRDGLRRPVEPELIRDAAGLSADDLGKLSRPGFRVVLHDTLEDFYLAEALEYITAWRQATADDPVGICGPIGPTEQLPLVARLVNELGLDLRHAHFWGMDEWCEHGREVPVTHPLSFERADRELCFDRIRPELRMPEANLHFPKADVGPYIASWSQARCAVMQGGQGEIKHWAFNDPLRRAGKHADAPPSAADYRGLSTRVVDLHPVTLAQNARTSGGGNITMVPTQAITVGPVQTWQAEKVSIWHAGMHDNPLGQRLTALMISKRIVDTSVPMSLLAEHPHVQFNYFRGGLGTCAVEMH